jgi:hypothetical protein
VVRCTFSPVRAWRPAVVARLARTLGVAEGYFLYSMGIEYKLRFSVPANYDPTALFKKLPSPIHRASMTEIYNYKIEKDGFYFIDHLVNDAVASVAFKQFVNEALSLSDQIQLHEP